MAQNKFPEDYGFLSFHNDRSHKGHFYTYEKEKVDFFDGNVRDEDEPIEDNETSSKENIDAEKPTENESTPLDSELNEVGEGIEEDTNEIEKEDA